MKNSYHFHFYPLLVRKGPFGDQIWSTICESYKRSFDKLFGLSNSYPLTLQFHGFHFCFRVIFGTFRVIFLRGKCASLTPRFPLAGKAMLLNIAHFLKEKRGAIASSKRTIYGGIVRPKKFKNGEKQIILKFFNWW